VWSPFASTCKLVCNNFPSATWKKCVVITMSHPLLT
jgi:hypothetical protein